VQDNQSGGIDTGNAFFGGPTLLDANEINPRLGSGFTGMIGKQWGDYAIEFGGFYIAQQTSFKQIEDKGSINAPFANPPLGFEGDNGLWLQGDVFKASLSDQIGSAELNFRKWNLGCPYISSMCGIRYFDVLERFNQFMGDDDLTVLNINGKPDPTREATYSTTAHNRIIAPQLGLEFNYPLGMWLAIDITAKGAWGVNFLETDIQLQRGDGLIGRQGGQSGAVFSQLYDLGFNFDVFITPHTRIRAGYNLLFALDVGTAPNQVDYDLSHSTNFNHDGNMFFHGPSVQFQWAY
jgi:Putative beta barrel porin-7 (BBP7)